MNAQQEHISRLQEAQDLLREALDILRNVASETDSGSAGAYILPNLEMLIDDEHPWIGRQYNVENWMNDLRDENTEGDEPEFVYVPAPPTAPATFPHTPEFAAKLYAKYGESNQRINAIKDYRIEYGGMLKEAKDAVWYIFDKAQGEQS